MPRKDSWSNYIWFKIFFPIIVDRLGIHDILSPPVTVVKCFLAMYISVRIEIYLRPFWVLLM